MEGKFSSGMRWSEYSSSSGEKSPSVVIEDLCEDGTYPVNDNYVITYPDSEVELEQKLQPIYDEKNEDYKLLNRYYENPLFITASEVFKDEISDGGSQELMKSEGKKFKDYKFCEAVNDFDIELEGGEAVPIVYLPTTRAARLQRALRLGGYKKVRVH